MFERDRDQVRQAGKIKVVWLGRNKELPDGSKRIDYEVRKAARRERVCFVFQECDTPLGLAPTEVFSVM